MEDFYSVLESTICDEVELDGGKHLTAEDFVNIFYKECGDE